MTAKSLSIATACALCLGLISILLTLSLRHTFFAIFCSMLFLLAFKRMVQGWTIAEGSYKTNETLFKQEIVGIISAFMASTGIGLTYILVNYVFDFQPSNIDCSSNDQFPKQFFVFECTESPGKTAVKFWIFFSVIAITWSLARRYMVREHWDEL